MGTLTANQPLLPEYCDHKLPTSCRLTSIPNCCACADERAHAASYRTYIDGIGFVPRGTRWQRYCWFCKEFWERRVEVSGLRSGQTRIPQVPDQSPFLEKWYEFYRGYRVVKKDDGSEERVAVLGEEFRNVSPGCLPRTLEEMRAGRQQSEASESMPQQSVVQEDEAPRGPTLDETLDQLFQDAASEESRQPTSSSQGPPPGAARSHASRDRAPETPHAQVMVPTGSRSQEYGARRAAGLRRELLRMRNGIERVISGLRDLGEEVPNQDETAGALSNLTENSISEDLSGAEAQRLLNDVGQLTTRAGATQVDGPLANLQSRVDDARSAVEEARRTRDQAAEDLADADSGLHSSRRRLEQLQRERTSAENYMRTFGTREEMAAQGESYVSPISNMFSRAYERFHVAEEVRREERTLRQVLEDEAREAGVTLGPTALSQEGTPTDVWGVPAPRVWPSNRTWPGFLPTDAHYISPLGIKGELLNAADLMAEGIPSPADDSGNPYEDWVSCAWFVVGMLKKEVFLERTLPNGITPNSVFELDYDRQAGEFSPAHIIMLNDLFANQVLMWRFGVPQFLFSSLRLRSLRHGQLPRSTLPWLECIGSMEFAYRHSRFLRDLSPQDDEQTANTLQRLRSGETVQADLDLMLRMITTFYDSTLFREALLEINPDEWLTLDAWFLLRAFASDPVMQEEYDLTPIGIERYAVFLVTKENAQTLSIPGTETYSHEWTEDDSLIVRTGLLSDWVIRQKQYLHRGGWQLWWDHDHGSDKPEGERRCRGHVNHHLAQAFTKRAFILSAEVRARVPQSYHTQILEDISNNVISTSSEDLLAQLFEHSQGLIHQIVKAQIEAEPETETVGPTLNDIRAALAETEDSDAHRTDSRDAAQQMALAAGRQAMRTGSQSVMENLQASEARAEADRAEAGTTSRMTGRGATLYRPSALEIISLMGLGRSEQHGEDLLRDEDEDLEDRMPRGLDALNTGRPDPKDDEEMRLMMDCRICFTQIADIACLPCGHLAMCRWCSEQHSPTAVNDRTRPLAPTSCPVCRKRVRSKHRVYRP